MKWIVEAESIDDVVLGNYSISDTPLVECKDCKHHHYESDIPYCDNIDYGYGWKDSDFCSRAERRTDETDRRRQITGTKENRNILSLEKR